jgi:hypothetical protein
MPGIVVKTITDSYAIGETKEPSRNKVSQSTYPFATSLHGSLVTDWIGSDRIHRRCLD